MVNRGMQKKKKFEIFFQEASSINDLKRVKLARRYFLECFFFLLGKDHKTLFKAKHVLFLNNIEAFSNYYPLLWNLF